MMRRNGGGVGWMGCGFIGRGAIVRRVRYECRLAQIGKSPDARLFHVAQRGGPNIAVPPQNKGGVE